MDELSKAVAALTVKVDSLANCGAARQEAAGAGAEGGDEQWRP